MEQDDKDLGGGAQGFGKGVGNFIKGGAVLYIVLTFTSVVILFSSVTLLQMGPALALQEAGRSIFSQIFGVAEEDIDVDNMEEFWYNPTNVRTHLNTFWDVLGNNNTGQLFLTKNNFKKILENVEAYQNCIRNVTNQYKFYHHEYRVTKTETYVENSGGSSDETDSSVSTTEIGVLGDRIDDSREEVIEEDVEGPNGLPMIKTTTYSITDYVDTEEIGHINNKSIEDDSFLRVSWEEIYAFAAIKAVVEEGLEQNWETQTTANASGQPQIEAVTRLDETTIRELIQEFNFVVGYYFDPTSPESMSIGGDTYANHIYTYEEMDKYAYIQSKAGQEVEHGTEVTGQTPAFDYYEYKKPAVAPAEAYNCYSTIVYNYEEQADGTAVLKNRIIEIDGGAFYDKAVELIGEDFDMEWFVEFLNQLPGSHYDDGYGSLSERFDKVYQSYLAGYPEVITDTQFDGVGEVILGSQLDRTQIQHSQIRFDNNSGGFGGGSQPGYTNIPDAPPLSLSRAEFAQKVAEAAMEAYMNAPVGERILPSFVVAQALLESRYGESGLAQTCYNFWGMKYHDGYSPGWKEYLTWEEDANGNRYQVTARFCKWTSFEEGVQGYYAFIARNSGRYGNIYEDTDPSSVCNKIRADGWATDTSYPQKLMSIINGYDLTKYDEQVGIGTSASLRTYPQGNINALCPYVDKRVLVA